MTVFVTGAIGRLGGTLARTLVARGEKVRTLFPVVPGGKT